MKEMFVGEQSPAPRVVAGLRKLRPELTPAPVPTPTDPDFRISGILRQYFSNGSDNCDWAWVRAAVRGGSLLAWRDGTLPRRPAARLPLRHLHLRVAPQLPNAFQLSRLSDDASVATFQACNATDYARWVRALCVEILGQTPLPHVRFLDVLPAADTASKQSRQGGSHDTPSGPPRAPPRARRRLLTVTSDTQLPLRDHSPAATDEGIVVEDDDYDSSSDRSLDLSLDASKGADVVDSPIKCDNCSKLNATPAQHHTLPRAARSGQAEHTRNHRYLKRWEGVGAGSGGAERGRLALEAARRKTCSLESRARSCSPAAANDVAVNFVPVRERRALFESLVTYGVGSAGGLGSARSSEALVAASSVRGSSPRRASSMHDLATPPSRSVSDLRQYFEAVARASCAATLQRHSAPVSTHHHPPLRPYASLTCA